MGLLIKTLPADKSKPCLPIAVQLRCDQPNCTSEASYNVGYVYSHAQAMRDGWLERMTRQGRIWLCPQHSRKRSQCT